MNALYALMHKRSILAERYTGDAGKEVFDGESTYSLGAFTLLKKPVERDFVILNITDIHFSDFDIRALMAVPAVRTVKKLVKRIKPDLITVTGDIVCGKSAVYSIERFTRLMNSFEIPWAPVFGNHDDETNCDKSYLADVMQGSPYCLLKKGDRRLGCGNYIINIAEDGSSGISPVLSLIMADSAHGTFTPLHLEWLGWAAAGVSAAARKAVPCAAMYHIPNAQYQYAYDELWDGENSRWRDGSGGTGELNEKICCARDGDGVPVDDGFFDAAKKAGNVTHLICGHEHMNDFSVIYDGIRLTYTLKVGKASGYQPGFNGGTVIKVSADGIKSIENVFI